MTPTPAAPLHQHRRRHVLTCLLAVTASAVALSLSVANPAGADPSGTSDVITTPAAPGTSYAQGTTPQDAQTGTVHYAIPKDVCPAPAPGRASCMAVKLVPAAKGATGAKAYVAPDSLSGPGGTFGPADLAMAYAYDRNAAKGASQTVAVVDAYDSAGALGDLNAYDANFGLPAETGASFQKVNQHGAAAPPAKQEGWLTETALDIEAVRAVCALCKIKLVEARSPNSGDLATAVNDAANLGATEISNSYGSPEYSGDSTISAYSHPGIVITASTGDDGWYGYDWANLPGEVSDNVASVPAAYPDVVAVGGTTLIPSAATGGRHSETVWNENGLDDKTGLAEQSNLGASGGGCSQLYAAHAWQAQVAGYSTTGCGSKRLAADIAADADPYPGFSVNQGGSWLRVGGTSLSAPLIAAMWALAGGSPNNTYPAQSLYYNLHSQPSSVYDVSAGGNSFCDGDTKAHCTAAVKSLTGGGTGNPNRLARSGVALGLLDCGYDRSLEKSTVNDRQCNARTGYDGPSGVGVPNGLSVFTPAPTTLSITAPVMKLNTAETFTAAYSNPQINAAPFTYVWSWGDGSQPTSASTGSVTHAYSVQGTYPVGVTVTDHNGQVMTTSRSITVGMPLVPRIAGNTALHVNTYGKWSSSTSTDPNTGGVITQRAWMFGSKTNSTAVSFTGRFLTVGRRTLVLVVTDNAGLRATTSLVVSVVK